MIPHKKIRGMKRGYIAPQDDERWQVKRIQQITQCGVTLDHVSLGEPFDRFLARLEDGDQVLLTSYADVFCSLIELFNMVLSLSRRRITLSSIDEPLLVFPEERFPLLRGLVELDVRLRTLRTKRGLVMAQTAGKKLGRPVGTTRSNVQVQMAIMLRASSRITVLKACEAADCKPSAYYRYLKKQPKNSTQN